MNQKLREIKRDLNNHLPPIFGRKAIPNLLPGVVNPKTLANLDSLGQGPEGTLKHGRSSLYQREPFIEWFLKRVKIQSEN